MGSEQKIMKLFFKWSSKTGANLDDDADLECLYDLERFVGAHLHKRIETQYRKRGAEERAKKAILKRVDQLSADRQMRNINTTGQRLVFNERWQQHRNDDVECEKEIVCRIHKLQIGQNCKPKKNVNKIQF
ncbi:hypothetical protein QKQ66_gp153 [Dione juno nucleopolyhedrovirus]|uniref:Uncharacterized protein n=1 Tax=Dione juno nucleopolyhedrovirus TaxID=2594175 RepID=A0AAE6H2V6_9ABAC|nr:hypothetical protein QKQ66_gp153 [Dione juno nucleopolyhedrovirus]QDL57004.1 hypothetical protein DijuNPV-ORF-153 [Dione juno nucleopolyhedrovirus]